MDLYISPTGLVRCLYDETINLAALGSPAITRASHVEPDAQGQWFADLTPAQGPVFGPFLRRSDALLAEAAWLSDHRLARA